MSNGKKKIADFLSKNLGFQSEDFYLKRYIFGYISGQKQDNPAPRWNQLRGYRSICVEKIVSKTDQFALHPGLLIPTGCGVIAIFDR